MCISNLIMNFSFKTFSSYNILHLTSWQLTSSSCLAQILEWTNKHVKRCSASLIIRTTVRYHFMSIWIFIVKKIHKISLVRCGEIRTLCSAGGNVRWYGCCGSNMMIPHKINHRITNNPALPLLKFQFQNNWKKGLGLYTQGHSMIHTRQEVRTSVHHRWMDK